MEGYKCLQVAIREGLSGAPVIKAETTGNTFVGKDFAGRDVPAVTGNSGENY
jgi:hypothetical protein